MELSPFLQGKESLVDNEDNIHSGAEVTLEPTSQARNFSGTGKESAEERRILEELQDRATDPHHMEITIADTSNTEEGVDPRVQVVKSTDATIPASSLSSATAPNSSSNQNLLASENGEEAEFEIDSSPLEDTSSDTSSLSSSSEDADGDYKMLDPEEQARILMLGDGGSDDDGGGKSANAASKTGVKTQNEQAGQIVEKPALVVTDDMEIEELGIVENLVDNIVLIKAKISGEYQVLEAGSVLCLKDRSVIGVVAETLGRVHQPLYSVLFTNAAGIAEAGIEKSSKIFYIVSHSTFVFTQAIKNAKGSDASNIHDEEVGDDEMEFSDDEAEAAYKRSQKVQREERRGNCNSNDSTGFSKPPRGRGNRSDRGRRSQRPDQGRNQRHVHSTVTREPEDVKLSYDEPVTTGQSGVGDYDGPYIPLTRPKDFQNTNREEPPMESERPPNFHTRPSDPGRSWRGRGREDACGHGRGRGRGQQRGDNRGSYNQQFGHDQLHSARQAPSMGTSGPGQQLPPANPQYPNQYPPYRQSSDMSFPPQQHAQSPPMYHPQHQPFHQHNQTQSQQNHYPPMSPSYSPQMPFSPPTRQQPSAPYLPPNSILQGAFVNPAFFGQHTQHPLYSPMPAAQRSYDSNAGVAEQDAAYQAAQERLDVLRRLSQGNQPQ